MHSYEHRSIFDLEEIEKLAQVIDSGYNPDIDNGVKVNLLPLQEGGCCR